MNQALNVEIGKRLRRQREELQMTREQLCELIDVSPQYLSQVERGAKGLSIEKLLVVCDGLGLSTEYVLRGVNTLTDISPVVAVLATLDEAHVPLAESILASFFQAIIVERDKR